MNFSDDAFEHPCYNRATRKQPGVFRARDSYLGRVETAESYMPNEIRSRRLFQKPCCVSSYFGSQLLLSSDRHLNPVTVYDRMLNESSDTNHVCTLLQYPRAG